MTRSTKVLLVMDVVESVRMMKQDGLVRRWQQLVEEAEQNVLPLHGGRIVKSLGDGLMLEFASAQSCVKSAFAVQYFSQRSNVGLRAEEQMHLRIGGHLASFVSDQHDIYGTDVNLTARFCTLAGPGEMVVTIELRDQINPPLDADIEDMGECYLKHVETPGHAYRVTPPWRAPTFTTLPADDTALRPTIVVIPFTARMSGTDDAVPGEILAEKIIRGSGALARRRDTLTGISTGIGALVASGHRHSDHKHVRYSSADPTRRPPVGPDYGAVTDQSQSLPGLLAAGTRGGSLVRLVGISVAAPQLARWVTNLRPPSGSIPPSQPDLQLKAAACCQSRTRVWRGSGRPHMHVLKNTHNGGIPVGVDTTLYRPPSPNQAANPS